jgi:hypothetical protein
MCICGNLFSQDGLKEFRVKATDNSPKFYSQCKESGAPLGALVFYTDIPDLNFSMPNTPSSLKNKPVFDSECNCYVLCVNPTGMSMKYHIRITAPGYKPEEAFLVKDVKAGTPQYFTVTKLIDTLPPPSKFHFGFLGGLSIASMATNALLFNDDNLSSTSFHAGMFFEFKLNKNFSIQPELLFVKKGAKGYKEEYLLYEDGSLYIIENLDTKVYINYLEIPISLIYNINMGKNDALFIGAGPAFSYGLSGKIILSNDLDEVSSDGLFEGGDDAIFKRFDYGFNIMAGYCFKRFFVRAGYNIGLSNIFNTADSNDTKYKNKCLNFSVGIKF